MLLRCSFSLVVIKTVTCTFWDMLVWLLFSNLMLEMDRLHTSHSAGLFIAHIRQKWG